jgi:tRNA G10  N-methylase Trm11
MSEHDTGEAEESIALEACPAKLLSVPPTRGDGYTHRLFRYPAKFHPPVVRALIERYTAIGDRILDPFCGCGTLLIEAAVLGRRAVGVDVDTVAVEIANAKTRNYDLGSLGRTTCEIRERLSHLERTDEEYDFRKFVDLNLAKFASVTQENELWIPKIPNSQHWFRRYVLVDLAYIWKAICTVECSSDERLFFRAVFAAILRSASNADPVPVSGLEVTSHMKRKDAAGRIINPFALFWNAILKSIAGVSQLIEAYQHSRAELPAAEVGDATILRPEYTGKFDTIITSPPYHNAVDYYRRHQLEMFWLGHVETQRDRLSILPKYIGRPRVPAKHPLLHESWRAGALAMKWHSEIRAFSEQRANDFRVYITSMSKAFQEMHRVTMPGARAILVVGKSTWNGRHIPTDLLFAEIASDRFAMEEALWYPVKNRYMSYTRRNGADISEEYVLVFKRL